VLGNLTLLVVLFPDFFLQVASDFLGEHFPILVQLLLVKLLAKIPSLEVVDLSFGLLRLASRSSAVVLLLLCFVLRLPQRLHVVQPRHRDLCNLAFQLASPEVAVSRGAGIGNERRALLHDDILLVFLLGVAGRAALALFLLLILRLVLRLAIVVRPLGQRIARVLLLTGAQETLTGPTATELLLDDG